MKYFYGSKSIFVYIVISINLQASEELEERESLAQLAANADDSHLEDGETYIGTYSFYFCF